MIKTLLVDDEPIALKHLAGLIDRYGPELELVAMATSVEEALEQIYLVKPELVFLDIELAGQSSFEILAQAKGHSFELIFVTAYDQFGVQAIKHDATDYILKPIDKLELIRAIEKVVGKIHRKTAAGSKPTGNRLALPAIDGLTLINTNKIIYCESEGRYTRFHMDGKASPILVSRNLGEYEAILPPETFVRIHHQYLVNINYVERYIKGRGGYVILQNGRELLVSDRKKAAFLDLLE